VTPMEHDTTRQQSYPRATARARTRRETQAPGTGRQDIPRRGPPPIRQKTTQIKEKRDAETEGPAPQAPTQLSRNDQTDRERCHQKQPPPKEPRPDHNARAYPHRPAAKQRASSRLTTTGRLAHRALREVKNETSNHGQQTTTRPGGQRSPSRRQTNRHTTTHPTPHQTTDSDRTKPRETGKQRTLRPPVRTHERPKSSQKRRESAGKTAQQGTIGSKTPPGRTTPD